MTLLALAMIGFKELIVILLIAIILFGASRIPTLMRNLGKGVTSFKKGLKEGDEDDKEDGNDEKDDGDGRPGAGRGDKS